MNNIPSELVNTTEQTKEEMTDIKEITSTSLEEDENPLDKFSFNSQKFMLISNTPLPEEISIAPGKGK